MRLPRENVQPERFFCSASLSYGAVEEVIQLVAHER